MRRGVWHQCGDRSQELALEQLGHGVGVGVVISPRDLAQHLAIERATQYHGLGADVLIDQQFFRPDSTVGKLSTYPINRHRNTVSGLHVINGADLYDFQRELETISRSLEADGIIAPAVVYEAGRSEIVELNARLFSAARDVGNALGKPVYGTVILGQSATATAATINSSLTAATALDADGWYYGFQFAEERIPSPRDAVFRCCRAGLILACTGLPVMHAYAGPMSLLSFGFGATATGVGHSQNVWKFDPSRWEPAAEGGGGGNAPARHFSQALWGTIIDPDELVALPAAIRGQVISASPYPTTGDRWNANKHLVHTIGSIVGAMGGTTDPRTNAQAAITRLNGAVTLHQSIAPYVNLADSTSAYQANWRAAMSDLLALHAADFDYLAMLTP